MKRITAFVEEHQTCPLYTQGDATEFKDQAVEGVASVPVCHIALGALSKPLKKITDKGHDPAKYAATFCGGCPGGKAWFGFRKEEDADPGDMSQTFSRFVFGALSKMKLFAGVPNDQIAKIVPFLEEQKIEDRATIMEKGEPGKAFYIIVLGKFEVLSADEHGTETRLASLGMGDCFGEMSLISGEPVSATVRADGAGMLLSLSRENFEQMLMIIPSLSMTLARVLAQRLARASNAIIEDLRKGMVGKLEHVGPADLVQAMNVNGMTGVLVVANEGRDMAIHFHDGQVARVEFEEQQDEEAFYEFLTWGRGNFRFNPDNEAQAEKKVQTDTMGLLMEGMRRIDETKRYTKPKDQ